MKHYCPGIPKRVIFLLITAVFFVSQYAIAKDNTAPQYGGVMKVVDMAEGSQPLGVPWENTTIDTKLLSPIIETIVREEASGKIHPLLGTSWDIDLEAKTMTFKLRQGVKFPRWHGLQCPGSQILLGQGHRSQDSSGLGISGCCR